MTPKSKSKPALVEAVPLTGAQPQPQSIPCRDPAPKAAPASLNYYPKPRKIVYPHPLPLWKSSFWPILYSQLATNQLFVILTQLLIGNCKPPILPVLCPKTALLTPKNRFFAESGRQWPRHVQDSPQGIDG